MDSISNWDLRLIMLIAASTPLGRRHLSDFEYRFYRGYVSGIYTYLRSTGHGAEIDASPNFVDLSEIQAVRENITHAVNRAVNKEIKRWRNERSSRS